MYSEDARQQQRSDPSQSRTSREISKRFKTVQDYESRARVAEPEL